MINNESNGVEGTAGTTDTITQAEAVVHVEQKSDKVNRANRTLVQGIVAFLASGTVLVIWNSLTTSMNVDPTLIAVVGPLLMWLVAYAQNAAEENGMNVPGLTPAKKNEVQMVVEEKTVTPSPDTKVNM